MGVKILVWRGQPNIPGHVSMDMDGVYVSYWPGGGGGGAKDFKVGETHQPMFPSEYRADRRLERRQCDDEVEIEGLDTKRMIDTWNDFLQNPVRYNMVEHNCSTVVAGLLEVGSGVAPSFTPRMWVDRNVDSWVMRFLFRLRYLSAHIEMWTPEAVLRYANELKLRSGRR